MPRHQNVPDDATLAETSGLSLSDVDALTPAFDPDITEYTARVENSVNVVTVTTVTNNEDASRTISPGDADRSTPLTHEVALRSGQNTRITVTVLAEDRSTRQTYTIMVYRDRSTRSDNANLRALSLEGLSLSPGFSSATTAYNARVRYDVTTVTVAAAAADIGALVPVVTAAGDVTNNVVTLGAVATETVITVTVTAEDDETAKPYTITVYRESGPVLSPVSTLVANGLTLTGATLAPDFLPGTNEYTAEAANTQESVTIAATAAGAPGATVRITPADEIVDDADVSATQGHQVYLTPGTNTRITVTVTAEDRSTNVYTLMVYRIRNTPSDNGNLSALSLDGLSLSPAFDPETTEYDARVSYNVTMVTVAATAADIGADTPVVTGATANVVTLGALGTNTDITVTVTAEDNTDTVYMITVYRESGPVLGDDATLETLTVLPAAFPTGNTFAPGTNDYTARAAADEDVVTVVATPPTANVGAMVDIMPADQNSLDDGHQVYLTAGANTAITVTVTAENGSTNTYTIMVYRVRTTASTDATLSALSLDGVSLSPDFDPETTDYDARVRYDVTEVTVEHAAVDIGASVDVSATATVGGSQATPENIVDGNVVTLGDQGTDTAITVTVTDEAAGTPEVYTITVYRENIVLSDIATLAATNGLSLGDGVTLSPTPFAPGVNEYTARATNVTDFATVGATVADDPGAMVDIMPADRDSLEGGHQVYLAPGANTVITVTVTAENGSTNTYTFTVYRLRATPSTDATLSELSLSGAVLSPVFDPERLNYTATAAYNTDITTVTATASDIGAMPVAITTLPTSAQVEEGGTQVTLSSRTATTITVAVTAEDNTATSAPHYMITVYRDAAPSSDATLQTLSLSGLTLMPAFDAATTAYTAEVEMLDTTMVEAMATHPGATVEGTGEMSLTVGDNVISVTVTAEDETTQTYTVTVTVLDEDDMVTPGGTLLDRYDADDSDHIDLSEVNTAIDDYFDGDLTLAEVNAVIDLFFQ